MHQVRSEKHHRRFGTLFRPALTGAFTPLLTVPLVPEYEAARCDPEQDASVLNETTVQAVGCVGI